MSFLEREKALQDAGVPRCDRCGERDKVEMPPVVSRPFCGRCMAFVGTGPLPGRRVPDF